MAAPGAHQWKVFPSAVSVLIQYLSLNWPADNGWAAYNSLQLLAYFVTVFIAAPLALITGLGMSPALSTRFKPDQPGAVSIQVARSLHFLVLVWFRCSSSSTSPWCSPPGCWPTSTTSTPCAMTPAGSGSAIFASSMAVMAVAWVAATPVTLRHPRAVQRVGYALIGPAQRLFEHVDATPGQYSEKDISPYFWHNGRYPDTGDYKRLYDGDFAGWRLRIGGLVQNPAELSLEQLRALPHHEQITQHFCIQGWSGIARWGGVSMTTILDLVKPEPDARWVVFYSLGDGPDGGLYYDAHPIGQMRHHLTMLAYDMNGAPLTFGHGAPLRLRNEVQLGFKQVKWLGGIDFVANFSEIGGGLRRIQPRPRVLRLPAIDLASASADPGNGPQRPCRGPPGKLPLGDRGLGPQAGQATTAGGSA